MSIQPHTLKQHLSKDGFEFKQILRGKFAAVYEKTKGDVPSYETVRPKIDAALESLDKLKEQNAALQENINRMNKAFARIAKAHGIHHALVLWAMAENDNENYAEILARHIEQTHRT